MKLYDVKTFPSPRRVRIFLAEKGIEDMEYVPVDVLGGEARRGAFLARNPLGQVPVLELDDGTHISETTAICRYFEELRPHPPLFGATPGEMAAVEMWQRRLEDGLMGAVAAYFHHATPGLGESDRYRNREWGEKSLERAMATLGLLNEELVGKTFVMGDNFSIADITAFCAVDFAAACGALVPPELDNVIAWYGRVSGRPSASA